MTKPEITTRSAPAVIESADDAGLSLVCTMATENAVRMPDWENGGMCGEVLPMTGLAEVPKCLPLLNSHNRGGVEDVLGHVEEIRVDGSRLVGRVIFDRKDELGVAAYEKYRAGHLTDFSVGYQVQEFQRVAAGSVCSIRGRNYSAPENEDLRVAVSWKLRELSAVPIGADPAAKARSDSKPSHCGEARELEKETQMGSDVKEAVPPAISAEADKARQASEAQARADAKAIAEARAEGAKAERERIRQIDEAMKGVELTAEQTVQIRQAESVDQARKLLLEALVSKQPPAAIVRGAEEPADMARAVECAAVRTAGLSEEFCAKEYGHKTLEAARKYRNIGPMGICRSLLRASGRHVPDDAVEVVREVFALSARSDAASTTHLGVLLGNIANKSLLRGYTEQADTWSKWCARLEVPDYKLNTAGRFGMTDSFAEVGDGGEIHHTTATEESETFQVKLYAEQFAITEKQLVNDDQGVFAAVPSEMGAAARRFISKTVYTAVDANGTMGDTYAWMGTDHSNYITGTDTVMDATYAVAALDLAMAKMLKQTGLQGEPLDLIPSILLVPPEVAMVAESVFKSNTIVSGVTNRVVNVNPYAGRFSVLVEPRLSATTYTGSSTTAWYLIDPRLQNCAVAFLRGNTEPRVESYTMDPNTFGIRYRASLRFGVKALDYRGIVKSKGAA